MGLLLFLTPYDWVPGHKYHIRPPTDAPHIDFLTKHRDINLPFDFFENSSSLARYQNHPYSSRRIIESFRALPHILNMSKKIKRVAVIGAGPSGAIAVHALAQEQSFDVVRVFDRRNQIGGTWWVNKQRTL